MARVNLDELRVEEAARNKKYVWNKKLIIMGRVIECGVNVSKTKKGENHE